MGDAPAVRRLLAVCLEEGGTLPELEPALHLLRQGLPGVRLALLAPRRPSSPEQAEAALAEVEEVLDYPTSQDAGALLELVSQVRRRQFDAAVIMTRAGNSPYLAAYVCYLAGVPQRLGQSCEFGGAVLSHRFAPQPDTSPVRLQFLALAGRALEALAPARVSSPGTD
ncbi:MAG TPA: hypothetical protein VLC52_16105 [Anaerolineae bacterium]|nr:hypothetical protein [Anaerolineae bacterium]